MIEVGEEREGSHRGVKGEKKKEEELIMSDRKRGTLR